MSEMPKDRIELGNFHAVLKDCECCYDIVEIMVDDEGEEYEDFRDCHNSLEGVEDILQWYVDEQNRVMSEVK